MTNMDGVAFFVSFWQIQQIFQTKNHSTSLINKSTGEVHNKILILKTTQCRIKDVFEHAF